MMDTQNQRQGPPKTGSDDAGVRQADVLILGCHRCGTSALARAVNLLGLGLPNDINGPGRGNELGHWEPVSITRFNERLLEDLDRSWFDPKPLPPFWLQGKIAREYLRDATELWARERSGGGAYVLKDPRFSRVGALWRRVFESDAGQPLAIIACRNPYEVATSLARRDGIDKAHGLQLWQSYMLEAEEVTRGLKRMVVHYDALLADAAGRLSVLADFIGSGKAGIAAAVASIDGRHNHVRETVEQVLARTSVSQEIKDLYRQLRKPEPLADAEFFGPARAKWRKRWGDQAVRPGPSVQALGRPETFFAKSLRAAERNDISFALEQAKQACAMAPANAAMKHHLAKLTIKAGDPQGAIGLLNELLTLDPRLPDAAVILIQLLHQAGRLEDAAALAARATRNEPGNPQLHHLQGDVLIDQGDFAGAALSISRAIGIAGESAGHAMSLSRLALAAGWPDAAAGHAQRAALLAPDNPALQLRVAKILFKCGGYPAATSLLQAMVAKGHASASALALLARALAAQGHVAEAVRQLQSAVELDPGNPVFAEQLHALQGRTKTRAADR